MSESFEEELEREMGGDLKITHGEVDVSKRANDQVAKIMSTYEIKRPASVLSMKVLFGFAMMVLGFMIFMIYTLFHVGNLHPSVGPSVTEEEKETTLRAYKEADLNGDGKLSRHEILKWNKHQEDDDAEAEATHQEEENLEKEEAEMAGADDDDDSTTKAPADTEAIIEAEAVTEEDIIKAAEDTTATVPDDDVAPDEAEGVTDDVPLADTEASPPVAAEAPGAADGEIAVTEGAGASKGESLEERETPLEEVDTSVDAEDTAQVVDTNSPVDALQEAEE
eukprot:CAMPEP_0118938132 /NCGR_PEP_ID=MMETSP1169-20130426/24855_1 /TAXON_ID=36882 /ORGANISM="Pyramimonas obovata, Strain CCMP722" /LENGTH=279 /DNA_ID=CAMNT_0006881985 /DNA_START=309 /DNA_END=1145 /DNA_ORIENTATION=+